MNLFQILKHVNPTKILDIGAHFGDFYEQIKQLAPNYERYFAIEGNKYCKTVLEKKNIEIHIGLVGKKKTRANFYRRKKNLSCTGSSLYRELTHHFSNEEIEVTQEDIIDLDSIFSEDDSFDFIKIDTQGSELDILEGGKNVCKKANAILLEVSLISYNDGAPLCDEVILYMENYGYKPVEIIGTNRLPDGTIFQQDVLFLKNNLIL